MRHAPDQFAKVSGVVHGSQCRDTGPGEGDGRDKDTDVQGLWEDYMVVLG